MRCASSRTSLDSWSPRPLPEQLLEGVSAEKGRRPPSAGSAAASLGWPRHVLREERKAGQAPWLLPCCSRRVPSGSSEQQAPPRMSTPRSLGAGGPQSSPEVAPVQGVQGAGGPRVQGRRSWNRPRFAFTSREAAVRWLWRVVPLCKNSVAFSPGWPEADHLLVQTPGWR